jgi:homoserine kinase
MGPKSVLARVPATVGSFAGAMSCAALALDAPLNVKVSPRADGCLGVRYFGENGERVPRDRSNLVVRACEAALHFRGREFAGANFEIYSSVPVGVGLGSSAAAVLAGLIAADRLFDLRLEEKDIFNLASIFESRADNLQAAWHGGFVVRSEGPASAFQRTEVPQDSSLSVVVPETWMAADAPGRRGKRRSSGGSRKDKDSSFDLDRAMALARFFVQPGESYPDFLAPLPPTCEKLVPGLEDALKVRLAGTAAVFVCGSGPAVGVLAQGDSSATVRAVRECFAAHGVASSAVELKASNAGARELNSPGAEVPSWGSGARSPVVKKKVSVIPV